MNLSEITKNYRFRPGMMQYNKAWLETEDAYVQLLLDSSRQEGIPLQELDTEDQDRKKRNKLKCHLCSFNITDEEMRIDVLGQVTHCRTNPGGFTYRFRCFRDAPGCSAIGTPVSEHTWFAGYVWQIACCRQCGEHLGWLFKGEDRFYGLIEGRVVTDDSSS